MRTKMSKGARAAAIAAALTLAAAGCGGGEADDPNTVTVVYQKFGTFIAMDNLMKKVKEEFEADNPKVTIDLQAIEAPAEDYQTQVNLMNQSGDNAPDIIYEDSFTISQDAEAGYLKQLDEYFSGWDDAEQYRERTAAAVTGQDGNRYGVLLGTDTRGLWYNTKLFEKAGLETPWEPETWNDVLDTARTIKKELGEDVVPMNVYSGTPAGERAAMQGFEMLLSGTGDKLYEDSSKKWVTSSTGFTDSLTFLDTLYEEKLTLAPQDALDTNIGTVIAEQYIPEGRLAINLDGSWITQSWIESANKPWPEWEETMDMAPMPTQKGQDPGATSMSGGWALSMGSGAANPDLAWEVMTYALNKENATKFAIEGGQIPPRQDVAESAEFLDNAPMAEEFADLLDVTHFRPAYGDYPRVSLTIQQAMESVMTNSATPEEAAKAYAQEVEGIVGPDKVTTGG